jgi:hypothetical protein
MNIMFSPGKLASFCIRSLGALTLASSVGCHAITDVHQAIPASRLPCELRSEPREGRIGVSTLGPGPGQTCLRIRLVPGINSVSTSSV